MCMLCRALDSSCLLEYTNRANFILRGNWSSNRKAFLHIVLWGYKEEQTISAFANSTLQRTVGTNFLMWFPSKITKFFCRFSVLIVAINATAIFICILLDWKTNMILRVWHKSFWIWSFGRNIHEICLCFWENGGDAKEDSGS